MSEQRFCKDCKHFVEDKRLGEMAQVMKRHLRCVSPKIAELCLVTGERQSVEAVPARIQSDQCGIDGRHWEAKGKE